MTSSTVKHRDNTAGKVRELLAMMKRDVDTSTELHDIGISTDLASRLERLLVNPIESMLDSYNNLFTHMKSTMNEITLNYFSLHKDLISKLFNASRPNDLTYYIVLNDDNIENRGKFFEFLSQYETLGFQEKVPICIKFLPVRVLEKSGLKDEIILN
jgi:hypothetical protein